MTDLIEARRAKLAAEAAANERVTQAEEGKRAANGELYRAERELDQARSNWQQGSTGAKREELERLYKAANTGFENARDALVRAVAEEHAARLARDELTGGLGIQTLAAVEPSVTLLKRQAGEAARLQQHLDSKRGELALATQGLERLRGETAAAAVDALLDGSVVKAGADKALRTEEARLGDLEGIVAELERRHAEATAALVETREDVMALVRESAAAEAAAHHEQMIEKLKAVVTASMPKLLALDDVLRAAGGGSSFVQEMFLGGIRGDRIYLHRPGELAPASDHAEIQTFLLSLK